MSRKLIHASFLKAQVPLHCRILSQDDTTVCHISSKRTTSLSLNAPFICAHQVVFTKNLDMGKFITLIISRLKPNKKQPCHSCNSESKCNKKNYSLKLFWVGFYVTPTLTMLYGTFPALLVEEDLMCSIISGTFENRSRTTDILQAIWIASWLELKPQR